jgi:hypothetical protein
VFYEIEAGVPIPAPNKGGRTAKYPFGSMKVGESFAVGTDESGVKRIQRAAAAFARRNAVKLVTRRTDNGVRVWRTG